MRIIIVSTMNKKTKFECLNVIKTRKANVINMNTSMLSETKIMGKIWYESVTIIAHMYITNSVANYIIV